MPRLSNVIPAEEKGKQSMCNTGRAAVTYSQGPIVRVFIKDAPEINSGHLHM